MQRFRYVEIFYFESSAFRLERLGEQAGRLNFKTRFSQNCIFQLGLAVELEQFLFDRLKTLTVSVRLNYLQKYIGFFRYVENCSSYKAFFTISLRKKIFFRDAAIFSKINIFRQLRTYLDIFIHKMKKFVFSLQLKTSALMLLVAVI